MSKLVVIEKRDNFLIKGVIYDEKEAQDGIIP